jgi:hypothetical protein
MIVNRKDALILSLLGKTITHDNVNFCAVSLNYLHSVRFNMQNLFTQDVRSRPFLADGCDLCFCKSP